MRFSVTTYSYSRLVNEGKKSLTECIALAKESGFDGIEFVDFVGFDNIGEMSKTEYAEMLRKECEKIGIEPVSYTIGADFINGSDGDIDKEIERVKKEVEVGAALGVKLMRHDATRGYDADKRGFKGFDDALPAIIKGCREVTEYAKTFGIKTTVENHGFFCQESTRVEKIVNGVANENFGLLVDIGNFMCADEDPVEAVGRLAPYAFHVHAKDFHKKNGNAPLFCDGFFKTRGGTYLRGAIVGHGDVPVYQCISILKDSGYDGYVTVEFEGLEDPVTGTTYGLNTLKRILQNLG